MVTPTPDPSKAIDWPRVTETFGLSTREEEVAKLLFDGLQRKQMAHHLSLSPHTIDTHLRRLYRKIGENRRDRVLLRITQIGLQLD